MYNEHSHLSKGYIMIDNIDPFIDAFDNIIRKKLIKTVFQPILSLRDGSVLGHEALSRITVKTNIENTEMLFKVAECRNRLWELELLCRTTALETAFRFVDHPYNRKLFINVNPNIMYDETFMKGFTKSFLEQYKIIPENIIFEITEQYVIKDFELFSKTLEHYKSQSFKIAIDDAGSGYSGLNLISEIKPDFIKLDMNLIRDLNNDSLRFALVKGMVEVSKVSNIQLIAEGIESYEEFETLLNLGVQYGQGYFIQKPNEHILDIRSELLGVIHQLNQKKSMLNNAIISNIPIKHLCTLTETIQPLEKVSVIYEFFRRNQNHIGLCVIENGIPLGIITPTHFAIQLSGPYGYTLNQNKPVTHIMDQNYLKVDFKTSISEVSIMAMSRQSNKLYEFIVVTEDDHYIGTVTIKDLLKITTELEISYAKHQNPLSGLPGNLLIEQQLELCLNHFDKRSVAYIDIDNFKAYNDYYGFERGDMIIKMLANILQKNFSNQFIGHIGGDDFVIILDTLANQKSFKQITKEFEHEVLNYYHQSDIQKGYIVTPNRNGKSDRFPLMSITCVSLHNKSKVFSTIYEFTENLAELKRKAKRTKQMRVSQLISS